MSSAMEQLYQQVILDHSKNPHGRGLVTPSAELFSESHQVNTTCGDEVTLRVEFIPTDTGYQIAGISWDGHGCSISQASLSVLTDVVTGCDITTTEHLGTLFRDLMSSRGKGLGDELEDELGDGAAFTGVSQFPARIKCALLGWAALRDALITSGVLTRQ